MNVLKFCGAIFVASFAASTTVSAVTHRTLCNDTPCVANKTLDANKKLVANALDAFFNQRNASAVDTYVGTKYLQHNPTVRDGPDQLKALIGTLDSSSKIVVGTQAAVGDLVWTHSRYPGTPGAADSPDMVIFDIFRVKDGKIVEHWDIAQKEVPASQSANGRSMFPITPSPRQSCESKETLEANKKMAADALDAYFNKRNVSAVDVYTADTYLQHNPLIPDGKEQLKAFIRSFNSSSKYELSSQVAEADLVYCHGRYSGTDAPTIVVDVFRVKDGKFVEHWDIVQDEVPASQTASGRPMFPIEA
jgi:predicted SnoaL-like aldol condensation-catalyzing enzyme